MPLRQPQPVSKNSDSLRGIDVHEVREQRTAGIRLVATNLEALLFGEQS